VKFTLPIPKFSKFRNRSVRISSVWDKQRIRFHVGFSMGLISMEAGRPYVNQMKVICKTIAKYIKQRGRMSRKERFLRSQRRSKVKVKIRVERDLLRRYRLKRFYGRCRYKMEKEEDYAKYIIAFFPQVSITKKPIGTRMGKGKGAVNKWGMLVRCGRILVQIRDTAKVELAFKCLRQVKYRLPFKSKIICKNVEDRRRICKFYRIDSTKF
jgi:ribosomal protein L16/L10AE